MQGMEKQISLSEEERFILIDGLIELANKQKDKKTPYFKNLQTIYSKLKIREEEELEGNKNA